MTQATTHILIADDHFVVRSGLELIIKGYYADFKLSFASDFKGILDQLYKQSFNMLILDATFPDGNSLSIIEQVHALQPNLKILMYTALDEHIFAPKFFALGVKGYLSKLADEDEILRAVTKVLQGELYMSKTLKETMLEGLVKHNPINKFEKLSQREFEIMMLLIQGEANLEISNKLDIKPSTISTYKNRIFEKLGVSNIPELIAIYNLHHH